MKFAKAQQELALVQYQQTIQTAFREVSDALVQYRKVREIRAQQELLVTTLQDRSRLAHLRYEGGIDSLLNAAMILTGMGPVDPMKTTGAKLFASFYALFSGIVFLTSAGVLFAPIFHRFLHRFHLDEGESSNRGNT